MHFFTSKRLIFILLALIWLELSALPFIAIRTVKPDLFFIFLVFYAFGVNYRFIVPLALSFGLIKGLFSNSFFGLEATSIVCAAVLLQFLAARLDREKRWIQLAGLFVFSWFSLILFSFFALLVERQYGFTLQVMAKAFFIAVYTTVAGSLLLPFFERWLKADLRQKQYELF